MPENRTDRTDFLGLLALMASTDGGGPSADAQGWGMPYWNQVQLDAQIAALHDAPRDGVALLTAPGTAPSCVVTNAGYLPAGGIYDVCQTWVDEYGRETNAGAVAEVDLGDPIADPVAAATISAVAEVEAGAGFDGGLLEVWYAWIDENAGETLSSPVVSTDVPYRAGGLQTEVTVQLPSTPAAASAAGANVYVRHRGGNVVLAAVLTDEEEDEVVLDGSWVSCFQGLPLANTTYASKSIEITGIAAPAAAALTRFYLRPTGTEWTAGDRRLCLSSVDEWDTDTVSYPLVYTGASGQLIGGYPPTVSQVKATRPIDLETEALGTLSVDQLPDELVLETELVKSTGEGIISGLAVAESDTPDMGVQVATGEALIAAGRFVFAEATDLVIPAADGSNPRIDLICLSDDGSLEGPTENAALKGTPAATPTVPEPPAGYLVLAHVLVGTSTADIGDGDITDVRYVLTTVAEVSDDLIEHLADDIHASASIGETDAGTDTTKKVTPDGLAGSYAGTKSVCLIAIDSGTDVPQADGLMFFPVPPALDGMNLISCNAIVNTAGTTNATTVDIWNATDGYDMLSAAVSIASEDTIGTPGTVDTDYDDVATNDVLRVDVTTVSTTAPKGLMVMLEFRKA